MLGAALTAGAAIVPTSTRVSTAPAWQGTILCTTKTAFGHRFIAVDLSGRLVRLTLPRAVTPGLRVQLLDPQGSEDRRSLVARDVGTVRLLGPTTGPVVVRTRLIEDGDSRYRISDGDSRYRFYRHGRAWGCPVAFGEAAAVSVAQLVLAGRSARITLVLREGRLVHLRPQRRSLAEPARRAQATADAEGFVALLARGASIAACSGVSREVLLFHGGRDGCVMAFDAPKFVYRDHYADAAVTRVALFDFGGRSYALATIARHIGNTRAIFILERGKYRYLGDFSLSPIELW